MIHYDIILYEVNDKVVRIVRNNTLEAKYTGLNYSKPLTITETDMVNSDLTYQLLKFKGSNSWHVASDFIPYDFYTNSTYDTVRELYKRRGGTKSIKEKKSKKIELKLKLKRL